MLLLLSGSSLPALSDEPFFYAFYAASGITITLLSAKQESKLRAIAG
jgi:hypothetical protein